MEQLADIRSIAKEEITYTVPVRKYHIAKILTLLILVTFVLYISFSGVIHPLKLVAVHADIMKNDHETGYLRDDGKDTVFFIRTEIKYTFKLENMPYGRTFRQSVNDYKIRIEPKEKLRSLFEDEIFKQSDGHGITSSGNMIEIELTYMIGSIDPEGIHPDVYPPSSEVLEEIKNSLHDAELVIEFSDKEIKRFNLLDYKGN